MIQFLKLLKALSALCTNVFVVLRACDVVKWTWYVVLLPNFVFLGAIILSAALSATSSVSKK